MRRPLPVKLRARIRIRAIDHRERPDHLGLWALSIGFAAVLLAAVPYLAVGDNAGAAFVIAAAAAVIAIMLRANGQAPRF
jgi:hypothetical protein